MKVTIDLSPAQAERLRQEAECLGLTPEDLARAAVADLLATRDDDFRGRCQASTTEEPGAVPAPRLMRYLTLAEVVPLHRRLLQATGGAPGIREFRAPESAVAQPRLPLATGRLDPSQLTDWLRQHLKALE